MYVAGEGYKAMGLKDYTPERDDVSYMKCDSEEELLTNFIATFKELDIDVLTGWNTKGFDIPYLINRINKILGDGAADDLSPFGKLDVKSNEKEDVYSIVGISCIDYLDAYKKFSYADSLESYSLNNVAMAELGEKKISHDEYESMADFYKKDWKKFVDYNIRDVELVLKLEEKRRLLQLIMVSAYEAKVNFDDMFSPMRTWDAIIFNRLLQKKIIVPFKQRSDEEETNPDKYAGAYVKAPTPGFYPWTVSFDENSLYPTIIRTLNISPETFVGMEKRIPIDDLLKLRGKKIPRSDDFTHGSNGAMFTRKNMGILPEIIAEKYSARVLAKKAMLAAQAEVEKCNEELKKTPNCPILLESKKEAQSVATIENVKQMAAKIALNSLYGVVGNKHFKYYDVRMAEAVTLTGQFIIRWMEDSFNEYLNKLLKTSNKTYCFYCDTDAVYLTLGDLVKSVIPDEKDEQKIANFLDKSCQKIMQPFIDKQHQEISTFIQAFESKLEMKRESIASKCLIASKKHYILNIIDNEGVRYTKQKLKVKGFEVVKSSTPAWCKVHMKKVLSLIMDGTEDDVISYLTMVKQEFMKQLPEDVAKPTGINGLEKYNTTETGFMKGTPHHVKAAIAYNRMLKQYDLVGKYQTISDGNKIKLLPLKMPNKAFSEEIGFMGKFPPEFGLHKMIDMQTLYESTFLNPIKIILDVVQWKTEESITLDDMF